VVKGWLELLGCLGFGHVSGLFGAEWISPLALMDRPLGSLPHQLHALIAALAEKAGFRAFPFVPITPSSLESRNAWQRNSVDCRAVVQAAAGRSW
jgi:hypothetical protein